MNTALAVTAANAAAIATNATSCSCGDLPLGVEILLWVVLGGI